MERVWGEGSLIAARASDRGGLGGLLYRGHELQRESIQHTYNLPVRGANPHPKTVSLPRPNISVTGPDSSVEKSPAWPATSHKPPVIVVVKPDFESGSSCSKSNLASSKQGGGGGGENRSQKCAEMHPFCKEAIRVNGALKKGLHRYFLMKETCISRRSHFSVLLSPSL